MPIFGTENRQGVGVRFAMDFNGTSNRFSDEIIDVSSLSNSGDTVSNKRKISDLSWSLYDGSGTIWEELGHGTGAFGKEISLKVAVGGSYGETKSQNGTKVGFISTTGADEYTVHSGEIVSVSRSDRLIQLRSENKLNKLKYLQWQAPVRDDFINHSLGSYYGSYAFYDLVDDTSAFSHWNDVILPYCAYNKENNDTACEYFGHINGGFISNEFQGTGVYDTTGTGIQNFLGSRFSFLDTNFHHQYPSVKLKGSYLGTFIGDIDTDVLAKTYGYSDRSDADYNNIGNSGDTGTYIIEKIRASYGSTFPKDTGSRINESQLIHIVGDPTAVIRHCLFGKMVSDYLDETTDMGDTFAKSQKTVAHQVFDQYINPEESQVEGFVNDAVENTSSIFFVSTNNQFELVVYGPLDVTETLDSYGSNEILSSTYRNNVNDFYNKVSIKYGYDFQSGEYSSTITGTSDSWSVLEDRPFELESGWIKNYNQANNMVIQTLNRYKNTSPEISVEIGLNASGRDLGSLIVLEDSDSFVGTKRVQIVGYDKNFGNSRKVGLRCLDGESLYRQRGYASWEDSPLGAVVSGTSTSGWGNAALGENNGTVHNINESLYGSHFIHW